MKADSDDEMLPEHDFSNAVRGKFAGWFTPEEREQFLRRCAEGSARTWHQFALERVQALEAALFTRSVVTTPVLRARDSASATTRPFNALVRLVGELDGGAPLPGALYQRLTELAEECRWAAQQAEEGIAGTPAERLAHIERLERIGREAEALKDAVRGGFAGRWTPEEREQILRDSLVGTFRAWHQFARKRVQALEAALFTRSVVTTPVLRARDSASATTRPFNALVRLVGELDGGAQIPGELYQRLTDLAEECRWAAQQAEEGIAGTPAERLAYIERLERIGREAEALKVEVDGLVQRHLARNGMSEQEIERTTEETAKLWLAA